MPREETMLGAQSLPYVAGVIKEFTNKLHEYKNGIDGDRDQQGFTQVTEIFDNYSNALVALSRVRKSVDAEVNRLLNELGAAYQALLTAYGRQAKAFNECRGEYRKAVAAANEASRIYNSKSKNKDAREIPDLITLDTAIENYDTEKGAEAFEQAPEDRLDKIVNDSWEKYFKERKVWDGDDDYLDDPDEIATVKEPTAPTASGESIAGVAERKPRNELDL